MLSLIDFIKKETKFSSISINNTVKLLNEDASIPFIARYRKELTENLDEVEIAKIEELLKVYNDLQKRKSAILKAIAKQDLLTEELKLKIENALSILVLEDLYLPFKKKKNSNAEIAIANGLEPFAKIIMAQNSSSLEKTAHRFINSNVKTTKDVFEGALFIMAQWINEDQRVRSGLRKLYKKSASIITKVVKSKENEENSLKYKNYYDWNESLKNIPSHRFLAIFRAQNEGVIKLKIEVLEKEALKEISSIIIKNSKFEGFIKITEAIEYAFKKYLKPSFKTEFIAEAKLKADLDAINVFADNLKQLLLSPPLGEKRILAIDPGFKSGCKVVCLDDMGNLEHNENIYPHPPQKEFALAAKKIKSLVNAYNIEAIAIGNGTASRETEHFVQKIPFDRDIAVYVVNEAGASIYSASKIAREEFPNYDVTVRGAVSIGRRLNDPLSELVKIDPKAIGVGQYQHEVNQVLLKNKLDQVVSSCVNTIGVNVNTASKELLSYVSGVGPGLAKNIVDYRSDNGNFTSRKQLQLVPRLGEKAFEQAAGFIKIKNGDNILDNSSIHPESYNLVNKIAKDQNLKVEELIGNTQVLSKIDANKYFNENIGLPTINLVIKELEKPGLDPRKPITKFQFNANIKKIEDLEEGMKLPGIVNNITNFGCFVDIGLKESGLIHISKLANEFISDVNSVVKLGQQLMVTVIEIDISRKRIQLSLID